MAAHHWPAKERAMPPRTITSNTLFYGDNLEILREHIAGESVDLVYLDPPFNSARMCRVRKGSGYG